MAPRQVDAKQAASRRRRVLAIVQRLPDVAVAEVAGRGHLGFSVAGRRFAWYTFDHHGDGRVALACKAEPGTNSALAEVHPERFHLPAYLGKQGWLGLWLDLPRIDWGEVEEVLREAHRLAAPVAARGARPRRRKSP